MKSLVFFLGGGEGGGEYFLVLILRKCASLVDAKLCVFSKTDEHKENNLLHTDKSLGMTGIYIYKKTNYQG